MRTLFILILAAGVSACATTQPSQEVAEVDRVAGSTNTEVEKSYVTYVSPGVEKALAEDDDGVIDTRDTDGRLICERFKKTGSHRVQRICYTADEQGRLERENRRRWENAIYPSPCGANSCAESATQRFGENL